MFFMVPPRGHFHDAKDAGSLLVLHLQDGVVMAQFRFRDATSTPVRTGYPYNLNCFLPTRKRMNEQNLCAYFHGAIILARKQGSKQKVQPSGAVSGGIG